MMKRKIDELGRVVIPQDIRQRLGLQAGQELSIMPWEDGRYIILRALDRSCCICGVEEGSIPVQGKYICENCQLLAAKAEPE